MASDDPKRDPEILELRVEHVLRVYQETGGCPCDFRPFVYWAGKKQGPGWQDNVQNMLVRRTLELPFFEKTDRQDRKWWYEGSYFCGRCGTMWHHYSEEWRMMAYQERLLRDGEKDPDGLYDGIIARDVAATAGHGPLGRNSLSLEQWVEFMFGRSPSTVPWRYGV